MAIEQADSFNNKTRFRKLSSIDWQWILGLYGTAVGAGTLFLPINAGVGGIWPLIVIIIFALPTTFFAHRGLSRFVMAGAAAGDVNITATFKRFYGETFGKVLVFFYFLAIFPILLAYSVAITNTAQSFIVYQMGLPTPSRFWLALCLIGVLLLITHGGERLILKTMSLLVFPFICALVLIALLLVPHWQMSFINSAAHPPAQSIGLTLWLAVPVMVFSFNHSPMISAFAVDQQRRYGQQADKHASRLLIIAHIMMVTTVMFFVVSCIFSLTPDDLMAAKNENITVLSYLSNHINSPILEFFAPLIAFIAISKSFLGHYIGAREGLLSLLKMQGDRAFEWLIALILGLMCWLVAVINPSILALIEQLGGPLIAIILFIVPVVTFWHQPLLARYRHGLANWFVFIVGLLAISSVLYGFI